jgi:HAMP domain-containing protein
MSKPKYTVTLPDGSVVTRRTERTYSHVIVAHYDTEKAIADATNSLANSEAYLARHMDRLATAETDIDANNARIDIAREQNRIGELQAEIARLEATDLGKSWVLAWCGRPDLAQKKVDSMRRGDYAPLAIEVEEVAR